MKKISGFIMMEKTLPVNLEAKYYKNELYK